MKFSAQCSLFIGVWIFFLGFLTFSVQANNTVDGDNLFKLIGKTKSDPLVIAFVNKLGVRDNTLSSASLWTYPESGVRIGFYRENIIDKIMFYDHTYSANDKKFGAYLGKLPQNLTWTDTKSSSIVKLGSPTKDFSSYLEYDNFPAELLLYYDGTRIKSRLRGVLIRFKHCVMGDCQHGEGTYVERDGTRYEGNWQNGKRHGRGKITYTNGVSKEGYWENGVYKGQNFFKANGLYDLLGKHQNSDEIQSTSKKYKQGYQRIKLAYDYFKYVFNQNQLRFYFNEYGYLYKISVYKSDFGEFKHKLTENMPSVADKNYVGYIMGTPYKKYEYRTGATWLYKDNNVHLRIRFDAKGVMNGIDVSIHEESMLVDSSTGECKTGDCQNGYGESITQSGRYVGNFKNGKFEGQGTMYYNSGGYYKGTFKNGLRNGQGTYIWSDNSRYVGGWKDNQKHGTGTMYYQNKSRYAGQWHQNQRHGKGAMYYPNGDHYIGEWYQNEQTGKGTLYYNSGKQETGIWQDGKLQKTL